MKSNKPLTLRQMVEWANKNNISLDTPVWCCYTDYEEHFDARGIVYETEMPLTDDEFVIEDACNELVGEHCYCKDGDIPKNVIVITDGYHYYDD